MRICCISDTHSFHRKINIPEADILVCCGDITFRGELPIIQDFVDWSVSLPVKERVFIFGNHEVGIKNGPNRPIAIDMVKKSGAHYLEDSGCRINGLNFYGAPHTPQYFDWEWNLPRNGPELEEKWRLIPDNTDVLLTHCPPYQILDQTINNGPQGCEKLRNRVEQLPNLRLHSFGHLHMGYGVKMINNTIFVNASNCTDAYKPTNIPFVIELED